MDTIKTKSRKFLHRKDKACGKGKHEHVEHAEGILTIAHNKTGAVTQLAHCKHCGHPLIRKAESEEKLGHWEHRKSSNKTSWRS
jgi:hypothetical protein